MTEMAKRKKRKAKPSAADDKLRTINYAMERLGCSRYKLYSLSRDGRLDMVKFDGRVRISDRSLRALMTEIFGQRVAY